ncbi:hypothetical protein K438DRAFT_1778001 [Mycena galopus ATCC 62051]|nr:hypothetical protein K438DRAFT_1778001 [Mycena galopus ATCC 62051]
MESDLIVLDPIDTVPSPCSSDEENSVKLLETAGSTRTLSTVDTVGAGSFYWTRTEGQRAIYQHEALHGHIWQIGQSKRGERWFCSEVKWLIQLVTKRGLSIRHLILVKHESTGAGHYICVLSDERYLCDCCMPFNLGVPCHHFFRAWIDAQNLPFHISLIRPRWYQDPGAAVKLAPAVCRTHELSPQEFKPPTRTTRYHRNVSGGFDMAYKLIER